ncbi:hypothetical protein U9M48_017075 [Paspalum notatum var. saurae]|uniref:BZIP domain-containing protein n=1 Tax=Paspalum notatum var. saurae TaxID=547442 RepID=A0AAQ3T814_PASNO
MASEMSKSVKVLDEQEVTSHQRDDAEEPQQEADPLAPQSSIMSLTLEELQNSLCEPGRNFGSMNMDEFMANIWNAEEFQAATAAGCKEDRAREPVATATGTPGEIENGGGGLVRQGSFALPPPLSRKTVEEVWAEINNHVPGDAAQAAHAAPQAVAQPQVGSGGGVAASGRQATLGEMTLEDFLVKAGVVRGAFAGHGQAVGMVPPMAAGHMQQGQQLAAPMVYQVAAPGANAVYPVMGDGGLGYHHNGYPAAGMAVVPPPPPSQCVAPAAVSPGSSDGVSAMTQAEMMSCIGNGGMVRNGCGARKRESPEEGCTEKTVERRQRRMIKNRESAARSRARKQAYTVELEAELNHLKEENARLRAEERRSIFLLQKTILLSKKKMLVEKMIEQARENVSAKKGGRRLFRCGSAMW